MHSDKKQAGKLSIRKTIPSFCQTVLYLQIKLSRTLRVWIAKAVMSLLFVTHSTMGSAVGQETVTTMSLLIAKWLEVVVSSDLLRQNSSEETAVIDVGATNVCPDQYLLLNVTILADNYGGEISWQMTDASTNQILVLNENDLVSNVLLSVTKCVPIKDCYLFSLYDSAGDGLFDPGFWIVELDGKDVFSGGSNEFNGRSKSKSFGPNCPG